MKVVSTSQMRALDRMAVEVYGIPEEILMENAGESTYFALKKEFGLHNGPVTCICGIGNNGGDGLVVARKLFSMGQDVFIYILGDPEKYRGPAKLNFEIIKRIGIPFEVLSELGPAEKRLNSSYLIIDAIFGTGLTREVTGLFADVISMINQSPAKVLSIDIPSGINGDNGMVMGSAVKASVTVTYGLLKYGNVLSPGFGHGGRLYLTHISFPPKMYESLEYSVELNPLPRLPERPVHGHKGTFGHVVFVGGAKNYFGAPVFSSLSFLKAGGGYSILAAPSSMIPHMSSRANEVVFLPMEETSDGHISFGNIGRIMEVAEKAKMLVAGPGMGSYEDGKRLICEILSRVQIPVLIDGDGLSYLIGNQRLLSERKAPTILTPHPKEMERLSGKGMKEFQADLVENLKSWAKEYNSFVVYKSARTLICEPSGMIYINTTGNSGMGTAGSGDVLTGTIAAIYCLTGSVPLATKAGVFVHGMAGDIAASIRGEDGITANDILETLPAAMKQLRAGLGPELKSRYTIPILL